MFLPSRTQNTHRPTPPYPCPRELLLATHSPLSLSLSFTATATGEQRCERGGEERRADESEARDEGAAVEHAAEIRRAGRCRSLPPSCNGRWGGGGLAPLNTRRGVVARGRWRWRARAAEHAAGSRHAEVVEVARRARRRAHEEEVSIC